MNQRRHPLTLLLVSLSALFGLGLFASWASPGPAAPTAADGRVVMLGFDGADARTVRQLMAERPGEYPNFERLSASGTFEALEVVAPPESPVSWAALNTGQNPAKTGVPGFVRRNLDTGIPMPDLGHLRNEDVPIESLENVPFPVWPMGKVMGVFGGGAFVVVTLLLALVTRGKWVISIVVGLAAGSGAAFYGKSQRELLPESVPVSKNPNMARNFWDYAADAGVPCVILDAAQAFDMPSPDGAEVLAGLGVPDARGGIGDWFIYTTDPEEVDREPVGRGTTTAGTIFRVEDYGGEIESNLYGPKNFWLEEKLQRELDAADEELKDPTVSLKRSIALTDQVRELKDQKRKAEREGTKLPMKIVRGSDAATITIGDQTQEVREGEWSEFYELTFELNALVKVHALTRVRVVHLNDPHFELFVNVLDIDPRRPPFWQPISTPFDFSNQLVEACGTLYETYGWPTTTMPVKDKEIDPELLLEDVEFTMAWREELLDGSFDRDDWRCLMMVFSTTDRVQHMLYQFYDEEHPLYVAEDAMRKVEFFGETIELREAIPAIYKQMDRIIGHTLDDLIEPEDTLLICSDHGFQSFRRQVNVNNWLAEQGLLAIKPGAKKSSAQALFFVDWSKTRAYSLGMGFVYVNLEGREKNGIVPRDQFDATLKEIQDKLATATDPDTGALFCKESYITSEVHKGDYLNLEGDLLLGFSPTYRVSWSSTSGGLHMVKDQNGLWKAGPVCTDNDSPWSGGHVSVALPDVAGVFFSNKKFDIPADGVKALQLAPTVLDLLGVDVPSEMDLGPLSLAN